MILSLLASCLGCALATLASDTPPPVPHVQPPIIGELRGQSDIIAVSRLVSGVAPPKIIVLPKLINSELLFDYVNEHYPESSEALPEIPYVWVYITENGEAHVTGLAKSTRDAALDSVVVSAFRQARFKPASIGNVAVGLWTPVPLDISRPVPPGEKYTPYTKKPELLNRQHVARELARNYPPHLRDIGRDGKVLLWVLLNEKGKVIRIEVKEPAVDFEFNIAAKHVARGMVFTPAENRGKPVSVWIQIPIVFKTQ